MCVRKFLWSNYRLLKTLMEFWRKGSCKHYSQCKIQAKKLGNEMYFPMLCSKPYGWYMQNFQYTHERNCTKPQLHMTE